MKKSACRVILCLLLLVLSAMLANCRKSSVVGRASPNNKLDSVEAICDLYDDWLGERGHILFIKNISSSTLDLQGCVLTINKAFKAPLKNMVSKRGLLLSPKKQIVLEFNHDTPLWLNFRNSEGAHFTNTALIEDVRIECIHGSGEWHFHPPEKYR